MPFTRLLWGNISLQISNVKLPPSRGHALYTPPVALFFIT